MGDSHHVTQAYDNYVLLVIEAEAADSSHRVWEASRSGPKARRLQEQEQVGEEAAEACS